MKSTPIETQKILESLKTAVSQALEKKKRLGKYAVVWIDNSPAVIKDDLLLSPSNLEQQPKT